MTSDRFDSLSWQAQCFFTRLLLTVDDYGRYDARINVLLARMFPISLSRVTPSDIETMLAACVSAGLVNVYTVDGKPYLQLLNFRQQRRAKNSKWPAPPEDDDNMHSTCIADDTHMHSTCTADAQRVHTKSESYAESESNAKSETETNADAMPENLANDNSLPPIAAAALTCAPAPATARVGPALPRSANEVRDYLRSIPTLGLHGKELEQCSQDFFDKSEGVGWVDYHGRPIVDWRAFARRHATKWKIHLSNVPPGGGNAGSRRASKPRPSNAVEFREGEYTDL